ncbi:helix-turn-helix domain-containing protein [Streptomyces mirabilis]|uniref:helix-turn-helix domain-containing protein n=1 Tax=Streptomyces mirabilis TaxID=68239 RepID=UPI00367EC3FF
MGRREKPVDHSRPARGRLAEHLRSWRESAGMTYETLAGRTGLSPATLKRAACGTTVPKRATVEAYVDGCGGGQEALQAADELWRQARIEERGRLTQLHAPRPELISDEGDLSRALEVAFEQAGAPSLREIRERSGNPLALPVSSAARIVNRDTIPADQQQLQAFLTGCGVPPERHTPWLAAFSKISSQPTGVPGAASAVNDPWTNIEHRLPLRHSRQWLTDRHWLAASPTMQGGNALQPLMPGEQADRLLADHLRAEASRNGFTADQVRSWQPDYLLHHDGKYLVLELKSESSRKPGRGPQAGGTMAQRRPSGGGTGPTAARKARSKTAPDDWSATCLLCQDHASAGHRAA